MISNGYTLACYFKALVRLACGRSFGRRTWKSSWGAQKEELREAFRSSKRLRAWPGAWCFRALQALKPPKKRELRRRMRQKQLEAAPRQMIIITMTVRDNSN